MRINLIIVRRIHGDERRQIIAQGVSRREPWDEVRRAKRAPGGATETTLVEGFLPPLPELPQSPSIALKARMKSLGEATDNSPGREPA